MTEVSRHARHAQGRSWFGGYAVALVVTALVLVALGAAAGYVIGHRGASAPSAASAPAPAPAVAPVPAAASSGLPAHPTMMGDVTRVVDGDELVVHSGGSDMTVRVLGLTTPTPMALDSGGSTAAACGSREALQFADSQLSGQTVTLVPDPTVPEVDAQGRRLAYVVLRSQLNYTDAALSQGIGRTDTSLPLWYADVFARDQRSAVDARSGIWGSPCRATP